MINPLESPPKDLFSSLDVKKGVGNPNSPTLKGPLIGKELDLTHREPKRLGLLDNMPALSKKPKRRKK